MPTVQTDDTETHTSISYDVGCHGRTTNPRGESYSIDRLAEDLHAFVTAPNLDRPVICGVSMGGMIARVHASRYPDHLGGRVHADLTPPEPSLRVRPPATSRVTAKLSSLRLSPSRSTPVDSVTPPLDPGESSRR